MDWIPYTRHEITQADKEAVLAALESDFLTQGPRIPAFESAFAEYVDAPFALAVANGTAALHLAALALGVKPGVRVITTPITFVASANCVLYCGGDVSFCDVDANTGLIDLARLENMLESASPGTYHGVIPVDLAGHPVHAEALHKIAKRFDLWVIEDACHAPGGAFRDSLGNWQLCGNGQFSDLTVFSLHPAKHIAAGEGGLITTRSRELFDKINLLRSHGINRDPEHMQEQHGPWYYEMQELGYNYRMPDLLAALATSQLARAAAGLQRRHERALRYRAALQNLPLELPVESEDIRHAYHLFIIRTPQRDRLHAHLKANGILAQVHYIPIPLHPYYRQYLTVQPEIPAALEFYQQCLSLPLFPSMTDAQQERVIDVTQAFFQA